MKRKLTGLLAMAIIVIAGTITTAAAQGGSNQPKTCRVTGNSTDGYQITWEHGINPSHYIIERRVIDTTTQPWSAPNGWSWRGRVEAPGKSFSDTGVNWSHVVYYRVKLVRPGGRRFTASCPYERPEPVQNCTATVIAGPDANNRVTHEITWTKPTDQTNADKYHLQHSTGSDYKALASETNGGTKLTVTVAAGSNRYRVVVGQESDTKAGYSKAVNCGWGQAPPPPPPPTGLTCSYATKANGDYTVTWNQDGNAAATKYVIRRTVGAKTYWRRAVKRTNSASYTYDDAAPNSGAAVSAYTVETRNARGKLVTSPVDCTNDGTPPPTGTKVIAVGDIAECGEDARLNPKASAWLVGRMIDERPSNDLIALGDLAYRWGTEVEFRDCYHEVLGDAKGRTYPVVGNHEYGIGGGPAPGNPGYDPAKHNRDHADGYFNYFSNSPGSMFANNAFGPKALDVSHNDRMDALYYKANPAPGWDLYVIDSECAKQPEGSRGDGQNGCDPGSKQYKWLEAELRRSSNQCQIVAMHRPLWNSRNKSTPQLESSLSKIRQLFETYDVEMVLAGHSHDYERFHPMLADQTRDDSNGFQTFVIGSGGASHEPWSSKAGIAPNRAKEIVNKYGILELDLKPSSYSWDFLGATVAGRSGWTNSNAPRITKAAMAAATLNVASLDSGTRNCG